MRLSYPSPCATSLMSAPTPSQMLAISLMKETRMARKALAAYLVIWAFSMVVSMIGAASGSNSSRTSAFASRLCPPRRGARDARPPGGEIRAQQRGQSGLVEGGDPLRQLPQPLPVDVHAD